MSPIHWTALSILTGAAVGFAVFQISDRQAPDPIPAGSPLESTSRWGDSGIALANQRSVELMESVHDARPSARSDRKAKANAAQKSGQVSNSAVPLGSPPMVAASKVDVATDPWARIALAEVGADEAATAYWIAAINDPTMPADERRDLIEDLNEDGFAEPDHPKLEELPLILNRLALLDALGPSAMDTTNWEAMAEAYKDLVAMAQGLPHD